MDIDILLDVVSDIEPILSDYWPFFSDMYNARLAPTDRHKRDMDFIKVKFDKMTSVKNTTGDPSCPPRVRRSKYIAREILGKVGKLGYD